MNKDYNVLPKMLITCNPKKNWLYTLIYRPFKALALEPKYKFIVSLYSDNPYTADTYGESLAELHDNAMKQRLMYGNWEYDDDPAILMPYDSICAVFSNRLPESKERYITCDIARFGRDKTVIFRWEGFEVVEIIVHASNSLDSLAEELRNMAEKHRIPRSCIVVDESGVGGGVMDILRCKGFISNNAPIQPEAVKFDKSKKKNYKSLKDQCAFMLTEKVNNFELAICSTKWEEEIKEELDQIRQADMDREAPLRIVSKDDVKKNIGRSPDFSDALLMRLYFELHSKPKTEGVDYNTAANQYMAGASGLDPIALDFVSRTGQQVIQN
jgi:phage terminase large subunit